MVPIKAWGQAVGLVSIGEFFTPSCNTLTPEALYKAGPNKLVIIREAESGKIPVFDRESTKAFQRQFNILPPSWAIW